MKEKIETLNNNGVFSRRYANIHYLFFTTYLVSWYDLGQIRSLIYEDHTKQMTIQ